MSASESSQPFDKDAHNIVVVHGRIRLVDEYKREGQPAFETIIDMPSGDQYGRSEPVGIQSARSVGRTGDVVSIPCQLGGFRRKVNGRDGQDDWYAQNNTLRAVE